MHRGDAIGGERALAHGPRHPAYAWLVRTPREHRVELAGRATRVLELEGDGPPLLLLHGWADSADTWRPVLDRLAQAGRRALAVDLPGFGEAEPLRHGPVLPQLDELVDAALGEIAPGGGGPRHAAAVVAGNSLGGCLALRAAERHGLAGVVPIAPAGLDMARWLGLVERDPIVGRLLAGPLPLPRAVVRRAVGAAYRRLAFRRPGEVDPAVVSGFTSHLGSREAVARVATCGRRLLPELRDPFRLERVSCPVLLVWGRHDALVLRGGARRVLEATPSARLETIDDCGHCPQIERPERLTSLLLDFCAPAAEAA